MRRRQVIPRAAIVAVGAQVALGADRTDAPILAELVLDELRAAVSEGAGAVVVAELRRRRRGRRRGRRARRGDERQQHCDEPAKRVGRVSGVGGRVSVRTVMWDYHQGCAVMAGIRWSSRCLADGCHALELALSCWRTLASADRRAGSCCRAGVPRACSGVCASALGRGGRCEVLRRCCSG